ncbi:phosphatase PAP2 family protein [Siphonobacter sp. SORGH_AS_1065]|uniref:phosphatase PAP2 family protein n=1 Tax=Siphonobacter sp. SORGH_AS_1065 TaxID=3041795 RepID=UPI00278B6D3F|nr:phosphatase PAP2 family protein [Siphonobacter sp. SORGH_AS_1065]MDQ1085538.1 membrane-associated phospholipid phosphatase [Siphonobacter sp. SORGH_AS_1065]
MKPYFFLLILFTRLTSVTAQSDTTTFSGYQVNPTFKLPVTTVALAASYFGFKQLDRTASLSAQEVLKLNPSQINSFDRRVAFYDPGRFAEAQKRSDLFLNISIASPLILMLGKSMRQDALDLLTLYTTAHAVNNLLYFAAAYSIRRARPLTYNAALPLEAKTGLAKSNSFYSGHVSFSTTATFFAAKVFTDYYDLRGWKRIAVFSVAAVPPAFVGINRMHAGKHFPTDVLTGFVIGSVCGIAIPELHKKIRSHPQVSLRPEWFPGSSRGLALSYTF